jgi:hypothetical protein
MGWRQRSVFVTPAHNSNWELPFLRRFSDQLFRRAAVGLTLVDDFKENPVR